MAYNKKTWITGETIEASALNNMENGIEAGQNDDLEKEVEQNTEDIATNKASIEQNASDIATNKTNISQNASDIATNKTNISQNASDIATNKTNISQNASDIATNKTNISQNASDIATNKTNISQNSSDIEEINSALAACFKSGGRDSFTGNEVSFDGAQRVTATISYPSAMTSHDFALPICVSAQNGYVAATFTSIGTLQCTILLQDIRGAGQTGTSTPAITYFYLDK